MSDYDLNALVEMGKEDVLQFVRKNLFSEVSRSDGEGSSIYSSFFLAMKKEKAALDLSRTRQMLIRENEQFLEGVHADDPYLVYAMARAAGRVSQMQECLMAADRMTVTHEGAGDAIIQQIVSLKNLLLSLEKICVKLGRVVGGEYELLPLSAVFGTTVSPDGMASTASH